MAPHETIFPDEKKKIESLARERMQLEEKLSAASGQGSEFLLEACTGLTEIIDDLTEIHGKKGKIEYAAIDTKIKFSRKVRHTVKDVGRFEQRVARELDEKRISLEHVQKMARIIKLLKSDNLEKAREEAREFYLLLEMKTRLEGINEELTGKRGRIEKLKRSISGQLSALEWLEKEPAPDLEKAGRREQRLLLKEELAKIRLEYVRSLESMPLGALLKKIHDEKLERFGFPPISEAEAEALSAFLHKSGLESKSGEQLVEISELSLQKLGHLDLDVVGFRKEVMGRKYFLMQVIGLHSTGFLAFDSPDALSLAYLSEHSGKAKEAAAKLAELEKTAREDEQEWERKGRLEKKRTELAGIEKNKLVESLRELEGLEELLEGKAKVAAAPVEAEKTEGPFKSFLSSLKLIIGK